MDLILDMIGSSMYYAYYLSILTWCVPLYGTDMQGSNHTDVNHLLMPCDSASSKLVRYFRVHCQRLYD
jgi:hypothetical protein